MYHLQPLHPWISRCQTSLIRHWNLAQDGTYQNASSYPIFWCTLSNNSKEGMWTLSFHDILWYGPISPWLAYISSCTWWSHGYHIGLWFLPRNHRWSHPPQRSSGRGENLQMACDFRQLRSSFLIQINSKKEKTESACDKYKDTRHHKCLETQKDYLNIQRPK